MGRKTSAVGLAPSALALCALLLALSAPCCLGRLLKGAGASEGAAGAPVEPFFLRISKVTHTANLGSFTSVVVAFAIAHSTGALSQRRWGQGHHRGALVSRLHGSHCMLHSRAKYSTVSVCSFSVSLFLCDLQQSLWPPKTPSFPQWTPLQLSRARSRLPTRRASWLPRTPSLPEWTPLGLLTRPESTADGAGIMASG